MPKFVAENGETIEVVDENVINLLERNGFKPVEEKQEEKPKKSK